MNNFEFKNPTKIIFGKNSIEKLENEIPNDAKVLLLYGGGSIKKNISTPVIFTEILIFKVDHINPFKPFVEKLSAFSAPALQINVGIGEFRHYVYSISKNRYICVSFLTQLNSISSRNPIRGILIWKHPDTNTRKPVFGVVKGYPVGSGALETCVSKGLPSSL